MKLTNMSPPFAMFMTEKRAVIEPYLFCMDGGKSLIYTVEKYKSPSVNNKTHHIYESHFESYKHILDEANTVSVLEIVKRYQELNKDDFDKIKRTEDTLLFAKEMSKHEESFKKSISEIFSRLDKS